MARTDRRISTALDGGGATVWLTGLPSSGKSTVATELKERLAAGNRRAQVLDGDELRLVLSAGLGFSRQHRYDNVQRIGFVADLLSQHGVITLVPVIAPYADARAAVRARHHLSGTPYLEVHVAAPVEVCAERDVKGLYARQRAGEVRGLTGVDDPYEVPEAPDLVLDTHHSSVDESVTALHGLLVTRGLV